MKIDLLVYIVDDHLIDYAHEALNSSFGIYDYSHLERKTYVQSLAQMYRLRSDKQGQHSRLYERLVIPFLNDNKNLRGLDFGSGFGDYANMLRNKGYIIHDVEFYRKKKELNCIDQQAVHQMIDVLCEDIKNHGLYDYIVCDSVINSVDSIDAEIAVIDTLRALCKKNGDIFISGRRLEHELSSFKNKKALSKSGRIVFLDKNKFTATHRNGQFYYQHFHSKNDISNLLNRHNLKLILLDEETTSFRLHVKNNGIDKDSAIKAIKFEFDMKQEDGESMNRSNDVIKSLLNI